MSRRFNSVNTGPVFKDVYFSSNYMNKRLRIPVYDSAPNTAGGGTCIWTLRYAWTIDQGTTSGTQSNVFQDTASAPTTEPNQGSTSVTTSVNASANKMHTTVLTLTLPNLVARRSSSTSGDLLWFVLNKQGATDTNTGDINVIQVTPTYQSWSQGFYDDF